MIQEVAVPSPKIFAFLLAPLALPGCGAGPENVSGTSAPTRNGDVEIVTLRMRDALVEIRTGKTGRRFTVFDADGTALAVNLTSEEFRSRFPVQFEAVERGLADSDGGVLDASAREFSPTETTPAPLERR